jgi:2-C-methyl-D-erythritol 2,4-cyclodiphosphate synthase/2-C-methyl-D-erythritol 4-phosphate cytidylyltransferase
MEAYQGGLSSGETAFQVVAGGDRRQDSVANGFAQVSSNTDIVLVHDAARPFVGPEVISRTIAAATEFGAAIPAVAAKDTVKVGITKDDQTVVASTLPRDEVYLAQTPQGFRRKVLEDAIAQGLESDATDESMLVERAGYTVRLVEGDPTNIKVTTKEDLALARLRFQDGNRSNETRVGIGYDLHRIEMGRPLILGGVNIPSDFGLSGHSDADAVCHAVVDAMLGAASCGDIGQHFPDSDAQWEGISSLDLMQRTYALVYKQGFIVRNVDVVIIAEHPKIGPYVEDMRLNLAKVLSVELTRINIKGKTNEGVDAVGRGEAIAVQAVAMLEKMSVDVAASNENPDLE